MGKRELISRRKKRQQSGSNLTIILIISAFIIIAVGMVILTQYKPAGPIIVPDRETAAITNGMTMGDPNASVKVIEFADFQCPACASSWEQLDPYLIDTYVDTGKILFEYSPFSFLGQGYAWDESKKSAEAAYCANDQGKFWEYRDYIFANHDGENGGVYTREKLIAFAENLDLAQSTFKECLDSGKYTQQVEDATTFAEEQGATYTPSFLINGVIVSANELTQAIDSALAQ